MGGGFFRINGKKPSTIVVKSANLFACKLKTKAYFCYHFNLINDKH
jgi:hypothetical protein